MSGYHQDCDRCLFDWHYCPILNDAVGHDHDCELDHPDIEDGEDLLT